MKSMVSVGLPDLDDALAHFPQVLKDIAPYEQHVGYKSSKVPGRSRNWMQWNDGGTPLRIRFDNSRGVIKTWKLFARFGQAPASPWDKPDRYDYPKAQWMPAGADVWGCSYEALTEYLNRIQELEALLKQDLMSSYRYSLGRYG